MWRQAWQWVIAGCLTLGGCGKQAVAPPARPPAVAPAQTAGAGPSASTPAPAVAAIIRKQILWLSKEDPVQALERCRAELPEDYALMAECRGAAALAWLKRGDRKLAEQEYRVLMYNPGAVSASARTTMNLWWWAEERELLAAEKAGDVEGMLAVCDRLAALPQCVWDAPYGLFLVKLWTVCQASMRDTKPPTAAEARPWWRLCELAVQQGMVRRVVGLANQDREYRDGYAARGAVLAAMPGAPPAAKMVALVLELELQTQAVRGARRRLTMAELEMLTIGHRMQAAELLSDHAPADDVEGLAFVCGAHTTVARWLGELQDFRGASAAYDRALASSRKKLECIVAQPDFALARVPRVTRTLLDDEYPRATREQQLKALKGYIRDGRFPMPRAHEALRQEALALEARWGLADLATQPAEGLERLQYVLRQESQVGLRVEVREVVREGLQAAIRDAVANRPAEVEALAAFYVAELRRTDDPFVGELVGILRAAADGMQPGEEAEQVFLLSLIADLFPESEAGKAAREEAIASCQTLASILSVHRDPLIVTSPSPLPGMSVIRIANATSHHLVWFIEGPDVVFVRLDPFRRASVVVRDGSYRKVVIVTSGAVTPYRGESTYTGQQVISRYAIKQPEPQPKPEPKDDTSIRRIRTRGPYALMATPPGLDLDTARAVAEGEQNADAYAAALADAALPEPKEASTTIDELSRHREDAAAFEALRRMATQATSPAIRIQAVEALMPFRRLHDVWPVWTDRLVNDESYWVHLAALEAILKAEHPDRAKILRQTALSHPDRSIRRKLLHQVGKHPDWLADTPGLLLAVCAADPDGQDGAEALRILGTLRVEASLPLLRARLYHEYTTRRPAAIDLFYPWAGDDRAFPLLLEAWESPEFASLHHDLAQAMSQWHTPMGLAFAQEQLAVDPPTAIHYSLLIGLMKTETAPDAPALVSRVVQIASVHGPANVRDQALQVLLRWQEARALPVAAAVLAAPTAENRAETARALAIWGSPEALAVLRPYADDKALGAYIKGLLTP